MIRRAIEWLSTEHSVVVTGCIAAMACLAAAARQAIEGQPWGVVAWGAAAVFWALQLVRGER